MIMTEAEQLSLYLNHHLKVNSLTQKQFVDQSNSTIDPAALNRILKHRKKANPATQQSIARLILKRDDATADDLWVKVKAFDFSEIVDNSLSLVSGFTTFSALLLAAMGVVGEDGQSKVPLGVRFAFSGQGDEPDWIENLNNLDALKKSVANLDNVYIADHLETLMEAGKIDGCFMLRETFAETKFENMTEKPVQICRVAIGHGTYCYLLGHELAPLPDPNPANPPAFSIVAQFAYLKAIFEKNHLKLFSINNPTVNKHIKKLVDYELISQSLIMGYSTAPLPLQQDRRAKLLSDIEYALNDEKRKTVVALIGFEPILNRLYHDLLETLPPGHTIRHQYLNIAKLVNEVSTYCLYCHPDVFKQPYKLVKLNDFLEMINDQYSFDPRANSAIVELLYPDDVFSPQYDILPHNRLRRNFEELKIRNNMLPLIRLVSKVLITAQ